MFDKWFALFVILMVLVIPASMVTAATGWGVLLFLPIITGSVYAMFRYVDA